MDRVKQTVWDAFGTPQPVFSEQAAGASTLFGAPQSLPANFFGVGSQTAVAGHEGAYDGMPENVSPIGEAQQADYTPSSWRSPPAIPRSRRSCSSR